MPKKLFADGVTGDVAIYEAGDDAPLTNPLGNLHRLFFHSALDYMRVSHIWSGTIGHPHRSAGGQDKYSVDNRAPTQGVQDWAVIQHNMGAGVGGLIVLNGDQLPAMASIQKVGNASNRFVSLIMDGTYAYIRENFFTFNSDLGAINATYTVYLFSPPIAPSGNKTLYIDANRMIASRGKLDTQNRYIRSTPSPQFRFGNGPTADVSNGGLRIVTPAGAVQSDDSYNGSFGGSAARGAAV